MENQFDIFMIYSKFCDIQARTSEKENYRQNDELQRSKYLKMALAQLFNLVESQLHPRVSIIDELSKLMTRLHLVVDYSEFSRFYSFVFFICRENGQKSITVSRAVAAWRLVLAGRFRLLNEWCTFVENNRRYNISEDTWWQVLSFSRCVHENLEGYDPEGAWPVLIDEFVEHMYRLKGSNDPPYLYCSCGDPDGQLSEDSLPGLKTFPGLKRKSSNLNEQIMEVDKKIGNVDTSKKRHIYNADKFMTPAEYALLDTPDESMESTKHISSAMRGAKSQCAAEGCLVKGFAQLFSTQSNMQLGQEGKASLNNSVTRKII